MSNHRAIHRQVNWYDLKQGHAGIEKLIDDPDCTEDTALLAFWKLDGPWHYADEQARALPQGELLIKLRERIISGHYPQSDIDYNPVAANKLSIGQATKLQNAGVHKSIMRIDF